MPIMLDRRWLPLLTVLLGAEVAYVLLEFAFNAAVLNVASGTVSSSRWDFHNLERFGRVLSGVGLGLLIYAWVLTRGSLPSKGRRVTLALLIFPPAIFGMVQFQTWIAYTVIPANATQEEKFAAAHIQHLNSALRTGLVQIEGVPLTPDTLRRPESKAFLTLATPVLIENATVVKQVVNGAEDLFKYMMQRQAFQALPPSWKAYRETFERLDVESLYTQYKDASAMQQVQLEQIIREIPRSQKAKNLGFALSFQWGRYLNKRRSQATRYNDLPPLGLSPREFLAHPDTLKAIDITDPDILDAARPWHFRIVRQSRRGGIQVDATKFAILIAEVRAAKKFQKGWERAFYEKTDLSVSGSIKPGLSQNEFIRSKWVQNLIQQRTPLPSFEAPLVPGLTQIDLLNRYLIPASWDNVKQQLAHLPPSPEQIRPQHDTDEALRAIYVPAIALAFSLFFSLLTLGKVAVRAWMILSCYTIMPPSWYRPVKFGLRISTLVIIVALPSLVTTNSLARTSILEAAAGEHIPKPITLALRWTLDVEPMIFPVGNTLLPVVRVNGIHQYHDAHASEVETGAPDDQINKLQVMMPLTVEALQKKLRSKGFDPGPIDGVIGPGTTRALKAFQRTNDLKPTGTQNYATIQALRAQ
ncbi:peptidoglycan-binding domain-containing protein [Marinobacter subterrani]|uniref:peptidoglycan-binding domain-containing protein n=1 Tax=Marinobacter subterrani TaxID=1658765 RepID=UPI002352CBC9|nr:peptidoglycan-binding domain-containing protein [Marinobacter subterrani]